MLVVVVVVFFFFTFFYLLLSNTMYTNGNAVIKLFVCLIHPLLACGSFISDRRRFPSSPSVAINNICWPWFQYRFSKVV